MTTPDSDARAEILARIRHALADVPPDEPETTTIPRNYLHQHATLTQPQTTDLLAENLADYRAQVHRSDEANLPPLIARLLNERNSDSVLIPLGLPPEWTSEAEAAHINENADRTHSDLDQVSTVITTCAVAIAETGTIVLDTGPGQGTRRSTLIPDHHICVIRVPDQVVASVPQALQLLDPTRPQTWISGPSATSDIELDRVEGVHGPRKLDVILLSPQPH
jgi:L-lactate dehydrogenase complex protein LldG